jgi:Ca2+-binding RTX toxin-like protein
MTAVDANLFDFGVPGGNNDVVVAAATNSDDRVSVAGSGTNAVKVGGLSAELTLTSTTAANDRLEINTLAGADSVDATALPDARMRFLANGGAGDDVLLGGSGNDVFSGGDGADVLFMGGGDNVGVGGAGDDVLRGEEGDDVLDGGPDDDILIGGAGDDVLLNGEVVFDD